MCSYRRWIAGSPAARIHNADTFPIPMAGLFIIAHAPLASALKAAAAHAFPEAAPRIEVLDVGAQLSPDELESRARVLLERSLGATGRREALILTDVFGATPSNIAQRLADGLRVRVVTGVNVPMLWRSINYADEPLEMLVTRALAGATQGVMQVASARPQNQHQHPGGRPAHDLDAHRHHQ
jgi:PTS system ascorbate-specific IIA component